MHRMIQRGNDSAYFDRPETLSPLMHQLLIRRGIKTQEEARRFLEPDASQLRDPFLLNDMRQAVEQLLQLHRADRAGGHVIPGLDEWRQVWQLCGGLLERIPFFPEQLAVSGGEIARLLGAGVQVRQFQADLLVRVQSGLLDNSRESLLTALAARARRKMLKSGPEEAARGD